MGSPMAPIAFFALSDIERSKLRSLRFQSLVSDKAAELGYYVIVTVKD